MKNLVVDQLTRTLTPPAAVPEPNGASLPTFPAPSFVPWRRRHPSITKDLQEASSRPVGGRLSRWLLVGLAVCGLANGAVAGTISFGGSITQSTQDGTGPALNNPSLNNIQSLQAYTVTLIFAGSITAPGTYNLTGSSLTFSDPTAPATETSFGSMSLTIAAIAGFDQFSLLACLTSGSGCAAGNQLDANFEIPAAMLNSQNVGAIGLDPPHPLDLLEDDGTTDIQGTIATYSNSGPVGAAPEPSSAVLLGCVLTALVAANRKRHRQRQEQDVLNRKGEER